MECPAETEISYSPNSLKGVYIGDIIGVSKGDTTSLDYSSNMNLHP